jgi:ATP-dependent DNA helicase RecG
MELTTPISQLPKIGKITAKKLENIGLKNCRDLLYHYPFRYEDWSKIISIKELKTKGFGTIKAKINNIISHKTPRRRIIVTEALVSDKTGSIKVVWFGQFFLNNILKLNQEVYLAGKIENDITYGQQLVSPSYEFPQKQKAPIHLGRLVPIYPTTGNVSQKQLRLLIKTILPLAEKIDDWLPVEIKSQNQLTSLSVALQQIHFPASSNLLDRATHRLKFDELFLIQLQTQILREKLKKQKAPAIKNDLEKIKKFVNELPFQLTDSQKKSAWEIIKDLEKEKPMNRLLEGDVGSGKTVVATMAILNAILNNYQVAYLAPTEILANQHFNNISQLLKNWPVKIGLFTRESQLLRITSLNELRIKKKEFLEKISAKKVDLVIGTHAILQENVSFSNLGLIIVDEQHRFGVGQRALLTAKQKEASFPHFLSMTATPIPRSLALTLYGDLDLSIIDQLPPGRKEVTIKIVSPKEKNKVYEFIKEKIKSGQQAFVICPLIDPSDKLGFKSVKQEFERLDKEVFPDLKLAMLHGKLKAKEKDKIMSAFAGSYGGSSGASRGGGTIPKKERIDILISTTVIEVGIDVPNATIMLIEGAERFGLAQLWQLKGRIGRSDIQSHCFLFPENPSEKARTRLSAILNAKNGFELAEKDLEIRGPGELFGLKQSGYLEYLKIARLSDTQIVKEAQEAAQKIFSFDSSLKKYPPLLKKVEELTRIIHLE